MAGNANRLSVSVVFYISDYTLTIDAGRTDTAGQGTKGQHRQHLRLLKIKALAISDFSEGDRVSLATYPTRSYLQRLESAHIDSRVWEDTD